MKQVCIVTFLLLACCSLVATGMKEVVCYIATWGPDITDKLAAGQCTIFVIAFGNIQANGNVTPPSNIATYQKLRKFGTKLLLSFGGSNLLPNLFKRIATTSDSRILFAKSIMKVIQDHKLDGVDIDWEFPDTSDREVYIKLLKEVKMAIGQKYLLTAAVTSGNYYVNTLKIYNIPELSSTVDYIHLMTYDYHMDEMWDTSGVNFNAPVIASGDSVVNGIDNFLKAGATPEKILLGIPFYGRQYTLADSSKNTPGSPFVPGYQSRDDSFVPFYNDYCVRFNDTAWTQQYDSTAKVPYMYNQKLWLSYENTASIKTKAELSVKYKLGGVFCWALHQDDFNGKCGSCKWPLLNAMNGAIGRGEICQKVNINLQIPVPPPTILNSRQTGQILFQPKVQSKNDGNCQTGAAYLPFLGDCNKFYQCVHKKPVEMNCPAPLQWDQTIMACNYECKV